MFQEEVPRNLLERTGKHRCIHCLAETPAEAFFRNDHVCDRCAAELDGPEPESQPEEQTTG